MDPQIKSRMVMDVTVYPCTSIVDGNKTFGDPFILKGYICPKYGVVTNREGAIVEIQTTIYLDGPDLTRLSYNDEIAVPYEGRSPIRRIIPYANIEQQAVDLVEVLL